MFSLPKLLVLALIIAVVWYGFKIVGRLDAKRKQEVRDGRRRGTPRRRQAEAEDTEDLVRCPTCDTFVAANARSCGRDDCPYPG